MTFLVIYILGFIIFNIFVGINYNDFEDIIGLSLVSFIWPILLILSLPMIFVYIGKIIYDTF